MDRFGPNPNSWAFKPFKQDIFRFKFTYGSLYDSNSRKIIR